MKRSYLCSALVNAQRITHMGKSPHFDIVFMVPPGFGISPKMQQSIDELGVIVKASGGGGAGKVWVGCEEDAKDEEDELGVIVKVSGVAGQGEGRGDKP